jgi:Uma2 family endonuclease
MRRVRAAKRRVTYADMLEWPDDGQRYELYDGEVVVVPAPLLRHQRVAAHLMDLLRDYEDATGGMMVPAPFDIVLSEHNVVQPDVVFFRADRRHLLSDWAPARVPPDLAVEVLSPSTETRDRGRKMQLLARFGVAEYWIVDPARNTLQIHALRGEAYERVVTADAGDIVTSPTLSDLSFAASRVFAR